MLVNYNGMKQKRPLYIFGTAAMLLTLPLIAMQFTKEVNWNVYDFAIMGFLLFGAGLLVELTLRMVKSLRSRILILATLFVLLFLIWAELAVGIFGSPFAGS